MATEVLKVRTVEPVLSMYKILGYIILEFWDITDKPK